MWSSPSSLSLLLYLSLLVSSLHLAELRTEVKFERVDGAGGAKEPSILRTSDAVTDVNAPSLCSDASGGLKGQHGGILYPNSGAEVGNLGDAEPCGAGQVEVAQTLRFAGERLDRLQAALSAMDMHGEQRTSCEAHLVALVREFLAVRSCMERLGTSAGERGQLEAGRGPGDRDYAAVLFLGVPVPRAVKQSPGPLRRWWCEVVSTGGTAMDSLKSLMYGGLGTVRWGARKSAEGAEKLGETAVHVSDSARGAARLVAGDVATSAADHVGSPVRTVMRGTRAGLRAAQEGVTSLGSSLNEGYQATWQRSSQAADALENWLRSRGSDVVAGGIQQVEEVCQAGSAVVEEFVGVRDHLMEGVQSLRELQENIQQQLVDHGQRTAGKVVEQVQSAGSVISSLIRPVWRRGRRGGQQAAISPCEQSALQAWDHHLERLTGQTSDVLSPNDVDGGTVQSAGDVLQQLLVGPIAPRPSSELSALNRVDNKYHQAMRILTNMEEHPDEAVRHAAEEARQAITSEYEAVRQFVNACPPTTSGGIDSVRESVQHGVRDVGPYMKEAMGKLTEAFAKAMQGVGTISDAAGSRMRHAGQQLEAHVGASFDILAPHVPASEVAEGVKVEDIIQEVKGSARAALETLGHDAAAAATDVKHRAESAGRRVVGAVGDGVHRMESAALGGVDSVRKVGKTALEGAEKVIGHTVDRAEGIAEDTSNAISTALLRTRHWIGGTFSSLSHQAKSLAHRLTIDTAGSIGRGFEQVQGAVGGMAEKGKHVGDAMEGISSDVIHGVEQAAGAGRDLLIQGGRLVGRAPMRIRDQVEHVVEEVMADASEVGDALTEEMRSLKQRAGESWGVVVSLMTHLMHEVSGFLRHAIDLEGGDPGGGGSQVQGSFTHLAEVVDEIYGGTKQVMSHLGDHMGSVGKSTMEAMEKLRSTRQDLAGQEGGYDRLREAIQMAIDSLSLIEATFMDSLPDKSAEEPAGITTDSGPQNGHVAPAIMSAGDAVRSALDKMIRNVGGLRHLPVRPHKRTEEPPAPVPSVPPAEPPAPVPSFPPAVPPAQVPSVPPAEFMAPVAPGHPTLHPVLEEVEMMMKRLAVVDALHSIHDAQVYVEQVVWYLDRGDQDRAHYLFPTARRKVRQALENVNEAMRLKGVPADGPPDISSILDLLHAMELATKEATQILMRSKQDMDHMHHGGSRPLHLSTKTEGPGLHTLSKWGNELESSAGELKAGARTSGKDVSQEVMHHVRRTGEDLSRKVADVGQKVLDGLKDLVHDDKDTLEDVEGTDFLPEVGVSSAGGGGNHAAVMDGGQPSDQAQSAGQAIEDMLLNPVDTTFKEVLEKARGMSEVVRDHRMQGVPPMLNGGVPDEGVGAIIEGADNEVLSTLQEKLGHDQGGQARGASEVAEDMQPYPNKLPSSDASDVMRSPQGRHGSPGNTANQIMSDLGHGAANVGIEIQPVSEDVSSRRHDISDSLKAFTSSGAGKLTDVGDTLQHVADQVDTRSMELGVEKEEVMNKARGRLEPMCNVLEQLMAVVGQKGKEVVVGGLKVVTEAKQKAEQIVGAARDVGPDVVEDRHEVGQQSFHGADEPKRAAGDEDEHMMPDGEGATGKLAHVVEELGQAGHKKIREWVQDGEDMNSMNPVHVPEQYEAAAGEKGKEVAVHVTEALQLLAHVLEDLKDTSGHKGKEALAGGEAALQKLMHVVGELKGSAGEGRQQKVAGSGEVVHSLVRAVEELIGSLDRRTHSLASTGKAMLQKLLHTLEHLRGGLGEKAEEVTADSGELLGSLMKTASHLREAIGDQGREVLSHGGEAMESSRITGTSALGNLTQRIEGLMEGPIHSLIPRSLHYATDVVTGHVLRPASALILRTQPLSSLAEEAKMRAASVYLNPSVYDYDWVWGNLLHDKRGLRRSPESVQQPHGPHGSDFTRGERHEASEQEADGNLVPQAGKGSGEEHMARSGDQVCMVEMPEPRPECQMGSIPSPEVSRMRGQQGGWRLDGMDAKGKAPSISKVEVIDLLPQGEDLEFIGGPRGLVTDADPMHTADLVRGEGGGWREGVEPCPLILDYGGRGEAGGKTRNTPESRWTKAARVLRQTAARWAADRAEEGEDLAHAGRATAQKLLGSTHQTIKDVSAAAQERGHQVVEDVTEAAEDLQGGVQQSAQKLRGVAEDLGRNIADPCRDEYKVEPCELNLVEVEEGDGARAGARDTLPSSQGELGVHGQEGSPSQV